METQRRVGWRIKSVAVSLSAAKAYPAPGEKFVHVSVSTQTSASTDAIA